jgi:transcriptional regulator GlxA family with amidase domain
MARAPVHVVIWLPSVFYSAVASTIVETLQLVNDVNRSQVFSYEFVSRHSPAVSTIGISFPAKPRASRKMDLLLLVAVPGLELPDLLRTLDSESKYARPVIALARRQDAVIAAHCGASYLLAGSGMLDGKRATISWWLKNEATRRFPRVRWEASRLLIRQGRIYTCGGGFSGLELVTALLIDLGFPKEERLVRKLMVLPPSRTFQSPYEFSLSEVPAEAGSFERKLHELSRKNLQELDLQFLARQLAMSPRTLSRRFLDELRTSPGKWIQERRLEKARALLEMTKLSISEVCYRVGYQDLASFGRLFSRSTGMAPGEFRKQIRS